MFVVRYLLKIKFYNFRDNIGMEFCIFLGYFDFFIV